MPRYLAARFLPADVTKLRVEDLPTIPEWWPLPVRDPETGNLLPALEPEARKQARTDRAISEAVQGPHDGKREQVMLNHDGTPPEQVLLYDASVVYVLDQGLSTSKMLTYRYTPQLSHVHRGLMAAVTDGFQEHGQAYAMEASTDDTTAMGYQER